MPDRLFQRVAFPVTVAHTDVRDKIVRVGAQHTLEQIQSIVVLLLSHQRACQQAVRINVLGVGLQNVAAVGDYLRIRITRQTLFYIIQIRTQTDLGH